MALRSGWTGANPAIAMSLRFDRINNFWFVLRHEIEHVLNKDGQAGFMLDIELSGVHWRDRTRILPRKKEKGQ